VATAPTLLSPAHLKEALVPDIEGTHICLPLRARGHEEVARTKNSVAPRCAAAVISTNRGAFALT